MAARTRSGQALIDDAYDRSDNIGAVDRHPRTTVLRYVNQGGAELWDLLIEARGPEYFRGTPTEITLSADGTSYALDSTFYLLISAHYKDSAGSNRYPLIRFEGHEEPSLSDSARSATAYPTHYQLRRQGGVNTICILPAHTAGGIVVVDWVPSFTDLADTGVSYFYGVNGWEEYIVKYAAKEMASKDEEWALVKKLDADLAALRERILKLAPKRDMHRSRRVKDVRGPQLARGRSRIWRLG